MTKRVIVDSGPLVAALDRRAAHHQWIREQSRSFAAPWLTCEAVVTEALHLLRHLPPAQDAILDMIERGRLTIGFSLGEEIRKVRDLRGRFRDVPMPLADACLVRMAELHVGHDVVTFDRDFTVYRKNGREPIAVVMPPA